MIDYNEKNHKKMVKRISPVLVKHYGRKETAKILERMEPIYRRFLAETPFIGGRKIPCP